FKVINWCEYDGISDPIIISRDEDCDGNPGDEPVYVLRRPGAGNERPAFIDRNNNERDRIPAEGNKGRTCDGRTNPPGYWRTSNSTGYWQYTQMLKVFDDTPPQLYLSSTDVFCIENNTCSNEITIPFTVDEECAFENIQFQVVIDYYNDSVDQKVINGPRIRGEYPKYRYVDSFPIGEHIIEIRVKDGCGNYNTARTRVRLEDCKAPSPVCINGLAAELMPVRPARDVDGDSIPDAAANLIWATDFIVRELEDCTGPVTYSISRLGEIPRRNQTSLLITCEDAGQSLPVAIYAWDNANNPRSVQPDGTEGGPNYDYCITYVLVQDNLLNCESSDSNSMPIAGKITTEYNVPVPGVNVRVQNGANQLTQTNAQGFYAAVANIANGNPSVEIIPDLNENHIQGVSTFDIILITKHILGSQLLDSPYKIIAADANNSESVSLLDVIQLRKLILGVDTRFSKNTSWRFVEKAFQFPQPRNPWATPFPEKMRMDAHTQPGMRNADFIAIKIGDVNPAPANNVRNLPTTPFQLAVADQSLEPGKTYKVHFSADLKQIEGYQFTLQFQPDMLELLDIEYGVTQAEHFGWRYLEQGQITTSWNAAGKTNFDGEQILFTLTFNSKTSGKLKEYLAIQSRPTLAEAYNNQGEIQAIQLSFKAPLTLHTPFTLYQNKPNPFSNDTKIGFYMREAATARLQIYSTDGRVIKTVAGFYNNGYQEIIISKQDLHGAGVYYYTLEVNGWKETRKMLLH
ncbi:MAG: T9SS type A sorting domain-containing protein, partial [Saprospiraceae bacterium]